MRASPHVRRRPLAALVLAAISAAAFAAGCVEPDVSEEVSDAGVLPPAPPSHVLVDAIEPEGLDAAVFKVLGTLGKNGPVYGGGEPNVWAHLDGTLYVSFAGCDRSNLITGPLPVVPGQEDCASGLVFRSRDDGASWERLNRDGDGSLADDVPAANGDADVAVDAAGNVYTSNLGGGIQVARMMANATEWEYAGDVVPDDHWADRQWMAAAGDGHVIMTWMGGNGSAAEQRAVAVRTTWNHGKNWSEVQYFGESIGWLGTVQFDPTGKLAYIPFTQGAMGTNLPPPAQEFTMFVLRSMDGGATWEVVDTGARITSTQSGMHWSGVLMAPAIDVTGDGTVVVAWAEDVADPTGTTSVGAVVKYVASADRGDTWTTPVQISERASSIMPWVTGGAGDRFAVTYYANDVPLDTDYAGAAWDVMATVVDGALEAAPKTASSIVEANVHQGAICSRGGLCLLTASDRALLDFFESDLAPDGRLVVTYASDTLTGGKYIDVRVAIQESGTLLLAKRG